MAHIGCGIALDKSGDRFALIDGENAAVLAPDQIVALRFDDSKARHRIVIETSSTVVPKVAFEAFWESTTLDAIYKALAEMCWKVAGAHAPRVPASAQ